jgi:hypothetical protein
VRPGGYRVGGRRVPVPYTGYHQPAYNIIARPTGALGDGFLIGGGFTVGTLAAAGVLGLMAYLLLDAAINPDAKIGRTPPPPAGAGTFLR